jgi:hypothetical protein
MMSNKGKNEPKKDKSAQKNINGGKNNPFKGKSKTKTEVALYGKEVKNNEK